MVVNYDSMMQKLCIMLLLTAHLLRTYVLNMFWSSVGYALYFEGAVQVLVLWLPFDLGKDPFAMLLLWPLCGPYSWCIIGYFVTVVVRWRKWLEI